MEQHEFNEFIKLIKENSEKDKKLAKIEGFANDLAKIDYRGNPPVEHEIANTLRKIVTE